MFNLILKKMKSIISKTNRTATKCAKSTLIFTFVVVTFLTTFTSCTIDEIPKEEKVLNSISVDIEPTVVRPTTTTPPPIKK